VLILNHLLLVTRSIEAGKDSNEFGWPAAIFTARPRETVLKAKKSRAAFLIAGAQIAFKSADLNDYL
jgi:hypothetical protein